MFVILIIFDVWGKIEDLKSYEDYIELKKRMLESKTCEQCKKYAIAYRICNNNQGGGKEVYLVYGAGNTGKNFLICCKIYL